MARTNGDTEWVEIDLEAPATVYAVQVNYHDHQSNMYGRIPGLRHRYAVEGSLDGQDWVTLVDRRNNYKDVPGTITYKWIIRLVSVMSVIRI